MEVGGRKIQLLYMGPAHTEGDMVAYLPDSKILFAGDLLFLKGILPCEMDINLGRFPNRLGGTVLQLDCDLR